MSIKNIFSKNKKNIDNLNNNLNLTPNNQLDKENDIPYNSYSEKLDSALKDDAISNIAITGEYGTGKSSIVDTYYRDIDPKPLKINFNSFSYANDNNKEINNDYKKYLYANIINQLIYQIDEKNKENCF